MIFLLIWIPGTKRCWECELCADWGIDFTKIVGKDWKDLQNKYSDIWKSEDVMDGRFFNANGKKNFFMELIAKKEKMKPGWTCWIWEVIEGENKRTLSYCFIDRDDAWSVTFLNKSTEFILET